MQAQTLSAAIANLNEQMSLIFDNCPDIPASASPEFYVHREDNPMEELKVYLLNSPANDKILFTGHLGSGKSTELNRFSSLPEIQERFFIIKYSISEVLNIVDIDYIDFLLSFAACLFTNAVESDLEFDIGTLETITKWIKYFKGNEDDLAQLDKGRARKDKAYNFLLFIYPKSQIAPDCLLKKGYID